MERIHDQIVMKTTEDAIATYEVGNHVVDHYVPPRGTKRINEVSDYTYSAGGRVPYHYHDTGVETYIVLKGLVEVTLFGKRCVCGEGDFINIPAHCPYGMVFLDEGFLWRGLFGGLDKISDHRDRELLAKGALRCVHDADYMEREYGPEHHYFELTEPVDVECVEKESLPQITPKGSSIYVYDGWGGIHCQLKVGRWNLKGQKEIWEFEIDCGYQLQYFKPTATEGVYVVKSGRIMIEVNGDVFYAEKGDIVHIPPYTPYTLTALTTDTAVYDYNVSSRLFRMLEMLELAQRDEPEKVADQEWLKRLAEMNESGLTGFVRTANPAEDK